MSERSDVLHTNAEKNARDTQLPTAGECWNVLWLLLESEDQPSPLPCF